MHVWPFYAGLAVAACAASWRNEALQPVGVAIVASWTASNAAHWWLPALERPAAYTVAEAMVLSMAFLAHVCGGSKWLVALVAVCTLSIGMNVYATYLGEMNRAQSYAWELATNVCFATECILVITSGFYDRARAWFTHGHAGYSFHGRSARSTEADR